MDHISTQEVIRSLISFTEKVHDKGSKEAQQTMIEFSKYKNKHKEGMFENDTVWKSVKEFSPGEWCKMTYQSLLQDLIPSRYSVNTYTAKTATSVFPVYTHLKQNRLRPFTQVLTTS